MSRLRFLQTKKAQTEKVQNFCGQCIEFGSKACEGALRTDSACSNFKLRMQKGDGRVGREGREKKKEYVLDLYAPIESSLKPCGFYPSLNILTEGTWLPYRSENEVTLRPSIILVKKGQEQEPQIKDFMRQDTVKGTFPSQDLISLMSVKGVQMLTSHAVIEPQDIDRKIDEAFKKHLSIPDAERIISKRWLEGSFFYDCFDAYPIQNILGVSESGKSRLILLNLSLAYHADPMVDLTEAGIFRSREEDRSTLCIDEGEYLNNPNLYHTIRLLLNASYSKYSGYVVRYDETEGKRIKRRFDLYGATSIAGIAGLESVTLSRAIRIIMKRVDKDFPKANPTDYQFLRDCLYVLRIRHCFEVHDIYKKTDISDFVSGRFEELFKPFFALTTWLGTKEEYEILKEWCTEYQSNFRIEALNVAQEEQVLLCIAKLAKTEGQPDWYSLKELSDKINIEYNRKISSAYVSNILTRLGITKRKKVKGYTLFYCPDGLLEESAQRIGLPFDSTVSTSSTVSQDNTSSSSISTEKPSEKWLEKAFKENQR